jgi:hypothetical protein
LQELSGNVVVVEAGLVEVVDAALVEEDVVVGVRMTVVTLLLLLLALEEDGAAPEPPGLTIEVVMSPLSMYTPEKFQSSVLPSFVRRSTPRCQSAPLDSVEAATGPAIFFKASEPVEW